MLAGAPQSLTAVQVPLARTKATNDGAGRAKLTGLNSSPSK